MRPAERRSAPLRIFVMSWNLPQTVPADDTLYLDARRLIEVCQLRIDVVAKAAERDDRLVFHGLRVFQHVPQTQTSSQCSTRVRVTIVWPEPTAIPLSHITYLLHSTYSPRLISSSFMWATAEAIWTACKGSRTLSAALWSQQDPTPKYSSIVINNFFPSVLWHCWLGHRKGIWPI